MQDQETRSLQPFPVTFRLLEYPFWSGSVGMRCHFVTAERQEAGGDRSEGGTVESDAGLTGT